MPFIRLYYYCYLFSVVVLHAVLLASPVVAFTAQNNV